MVSKGFNLGRFLGLGLIVVIVSSAFATLYEHAESDLSRTTFKILAFFPVLSLSALLVFEFWQKDSLGRYSESAVWRWLSVVATVFCVLVILFALLYAD
mgnify:CR=1 FL=1